MQNSKIVIWYTPTLGNLMKEALNLHDAVIFECNSYPYFDSKITFRLSEEILGTEGRNLNVIIDFLKSNPQITKLECQLNNFHYNENLIKDLAGKNTTIKEVDFGCTPLTIENILTFIKYNKIITRLRFAANFKIKDEGVRKFAQLNTTITNVEFFNCGITNVGLKMFAQFNTVTTRLNMSLNKINNIGIKEFAEINTIVTDLSLHQCAISSVGLTDFALYNRSIKIASFSFNEIDEEGVTNFSKFNKVATEVCFMGNTIKAGGMKNFVENNLIVTNINFSHCHIDDTDLKEFALHNTIIKTVYFSNNYFTSEGIADFSRHNQIATTVCFSSNRIGDAGAKGLSEYNHVASTVFLNGCGITDKGLIEILTHNEVITTLYLGGNHISVEGIKALKLNRCITKLDLSRNSIDECGAKEFTLNNQLITTVKFSVADIKESGIREFIEHNKIVTHFIFSPDSNIRFKLSANVIKLLAASQVESITLSDISYEDAQIMAEANPLHRANFRIQAGQQASAPALKRLALFAVKRLPNLTAEQMGEDLYGEYCSKLKA